MLLVFSGYRPVMLLNTLQCTGQLSTTNYQDIINAEVDKTVREEYFTPKIQSLPLAKALGTYNQM